jgi:ATP-binding cassette subfamily B protein
LKRIVPEVIQTSAMDCGPASLKCLLEGFGIPVSLGRLREACQTDVDGTSIDTLEEVAVKLGLDAEQSLVPVDHVLIPSAGALPALIVVRLPNGLTHFVVAWRRHGGWVQVMDPAGGRRWLRARTFLDELYVHEMQVPAEAWRAFAGDDSFLAPLDHRLADLGVEARARAELRDAALADPTPAALAELDAATRLVDRLVRSHAVSRGAVAERLLRATLGSAAAIPDGFRSCRAVPAGQPGAGENVIIRGAVMVSVRGVRARAGDEAPLPRELAAALGEAPQRPLRDLFALLGREGALPPASLAAAVLLAGLVAGADALAWQGLLGLVTTLGDGKSRLAAVAAIAVFLAIALFAEQALLGAGQWLGRRLELRLRAAFLRKIPLLGDRYFQSRLMSDMAERSHTTYVVGRTPPFAVQGLRATAQLAVITVGLVWLDPAHAPLIVLAALACLAAPIALVPVLIERDLRARVHTGAIVRYYLDAMLGLVPLRAHGGQQAVRNNQEELVLEWMLATRRLQRLTIVREAVQLAVGTSLAVGIILAHLAERGVDGSILLLAFWALQLPVLGVNVGEAVQNLVAMRSVVGRLLEPLGAPGEDPGAPAPGGGVGAVALRFEQVGVVAAGHRVLEGVDVDIPAGQHVAIVGASGAGKSSFLGLLLGWHRPAAGRVLVDGAPLEPGEPLARLRQATVWLDPAVQLWNRSLLDNVRYGTDRPADERLATVLDAADVRPILGRLPGGLGTVLGDGGALVSGGEGQRVRLARALFRPGVKLALLDEAFRGLDRERRREHLARARERWRAATLLCVSHDVGDTQGFDRVLVVHDGQVVEDGPPAELAARTGSRYRALLDAEAEVLGSRWRRPGWRRLRIAAGRVEELP